jgi:uncharacterized protein YndB with AHSA1/START domain
MNQTATEKGLSLTKSIDIKAPVGRVWEAITKPELIKKYFFGTDTTSDFKKGSPIFYRGVWEGKSYEDKGTILEVEKEKLLKHNYWSSFSGTEDAPENYANITYKLSPNGDGTTLTVTQDNIKSEEAKEHSGKNWEMVLNGMKEMLEKKGSN